MLHIGWAAREITPERPVTLHGQMHRRVSTHVEDPLFVTALAVEEGGEQAIILSCDVVRIPSSMLASVRDAVAARLPELDPRKIILHATHSHTAPTLEEGIYDVPDGVMTPTEYVAFFVVRAADAAVAAWQSRRPAGVSWAYSHAVVAHNRRAVFANGTARMYGKTNVPEFREIEGYTDHSVNLLFTWEGDRLTGVVVNLACPSQVTENANYVSADFWHEVREAMQARFGPDVALLPLCGAAGDQSPHLLLEQQAEALMRERRGVTERQEIARRVLRAVEDGLETAAQDVRATAPFTHLVESLDLPARVITAQECRELREEEAQLAAQDGASSYWLQRLRAAIAQYEQQQTAPLTFPTEVHVLRLGDIALATNPFELFLDYGLRIKGRSPAVLTFLAQQCCSAGIYLPSAKAVGQHYSARATDNRVGPEGGQILVDRTVELLDTLWVAVETASPA